MKIYEYVKSKLSEMENDELDSIGALIFTECQRRGMC